MEHETDAAVISSGERIAVVTTLYSEVKRLPQLEAEALIEAGDARRATEVDLAIGG